MRLMYSRYPYGVAAAAYTIAFNGSIISLPIKVGLSDYALRNHIIIKTNMRREQKLRKNIRVRHSERRNQSRESYYWMVHSQRRCLDLLREFRVHSFFLNDVITGQSVFKTDNSHTLHAVESKSCNYNAFSTIHLPYVAHIVVVNTWWR